MYINFAQELVINEVCGRRSKMDFLALKRCTASYKRSGYSLLYIDGT